jgi:hypothetical protein
MLQGIISSPLCFAVEFHCNWDLSQMKGHRLSQSAGIFRKTEGQKESLVPPLVGRQYDEPFQYLKWYYSSLFQT